MLIHLYGIKLFVKRNFLVLNKWLVIGLSLMI
ncbi:hypothetical protein N422_14260 [Lacticaseibacillus paracasei]|nr:hypothetical protein N422_14260 [Lacticaseibacillus paracasei]